MGFDSILKFFKFDDENEAYDDLDYEEEYEREPAPAPQPRRQTTARQQQRQVQEEFVEPEPRPQKSGFLSSKPKVVSMNRSNMEVKVVKPRSFEDSQEICNMLLANRPVIVNLEGFDPDDAQRIMDFISGCIYSINGKYHQISKYIFIFSPENIDISGESLNIDNSVSSMPVINREF